MVLLMCLLVGSLAFLWWDKGPSFLRSRHLRVSGEAHAVKGERSEFIEVSESERRPLTVGSARSCYALLSAMEVLCFRGLGTLAAGSERLSKSPPRGRWWRVGRDELIHRPSLLYSPLSYISI
jgi:hypothetical protein